MNPNEEEDQGKWKRSTHLAKYKKKKNMKKNIIKLEPKSKGNRDGQVKTSEIFQDNLWRSEEYLGRTGLSNYNEHYREQKGCRKN